MMVKTLTTIAAAGALAATAFAGGNMHYSVAAKAAPMASKAAFSPSAYVDVMGGMDWSGLKDAYDGSKYKSMSGNPFVFGADVGYNFMPHLAVELGGTYFMDVEGKSTSSAFLADGAKLKQWDAYGALKMSAFVMPQLSVFGKVGMDYHSAKTSDTATQFAPTFGAGVAYHFMKNWNASFQWRRVAAITDHTQTKKLGNNVLPNQDLFTVGVGYVFPVG